jgi:GGDEF domain-containing protein
MPIELGYDEVRGLAKKLKERAGKDIKITEVLADIAAVTGRPMDGMMHALKNERPQKKKSVKLELKDVFATLPRNEVTGLPTFEVAAACLDEVIANQPARTKGGLMRISVENAKQLAKAQNRSKADILNEVAIALKKACDDIDEDVFAASLGEREFVVLITGISAYDLVTDTIRRFENEMSGKRGSRRFPEGVIYIACAHAAEFEVRDLVEDCADFIKDVRPYLNPANRFSWNDPEGAFEW